jgi:hypothetical protein
MDTLIQELDIIYFKLDLIDYLLKAYQRIIELEKEVSHEQSSSAYDSRK